MDQRSSEVFPDFRVYLCGPFRLERREAGQWVPVVDEWKKRKSSRTVLKALVGCPDRQARRDTLLTLLWPDDDPQKSGQILQKALTSLRQIFAAHFLEDGVRCNLYRLQGQEQIWVDADAAFEVLAQAEQWGRTSPQALPLLEEAVEYLGRGIYLEDEDGFWLYERRKEVSEALYNARLWLAEAYVQQGLIGQAETQWRALLLAHPADEDVLAIALTHLHQHGLTAKALRLYEQIGELLVEEGETFSPSIHALIEQFRHEHTSLISLFPAQEQRSTVLIFPPQREKDLPSEKERAEGKREDLRAKKQERDMPSRLNHVFIPHHEEPGNYSGIDSTTLLHFGELTETCFSLSEGSQLGIAEQVLWSYLPTLEAFAQQASKQQRLAATIAAQGYLIAASLVGHRNDLVARRYFSEQALFYGKIAQDPDLQVAALRQLAVTFEYWKRPQDVLRTYLQAVPLLEDVAPRLRSCIYAALSGVYAQMKKKQEADRFIGSAYDTFSEKEHNEPHFLRLINAQYHTIVLWDGLNHLELDQPHQAERILTQLDVLEANSGIPERIRIELLNYQAETFVAVNDMERACAYLEITLEASAALGSSRRLQEAFVVFQKAREIWPHEQQVRHLGDLFIQKTIDQTK